VQVRNEAEQHRLLANIERMHREGRSEAEIVRELGELQMKEMGGQSCSPRPTARRRVLRPGWRLSQARRSGHADDAVRSN